LPEETKSFVPCKHIAAQAYYHYPLCDEEASKALRIMELAVKLKCKQLKISLIRFAATSTRAKKPQAKRLFQLMNEIVAADPPVKILTGNSIFLGQCVTAICIPKVILLNY
jgi:hypothetical protein